MDESLEALVLARLLRCGILARTGPLCQMHRASLDAEAILLVVPWQLFHAVWRKLLGFVDRWTDPPIMHRRINDGSDKYFAWRRKHEGDSGVDEFFDRDDVS